MPTVSIEMFPGRTRDQKAALVDLVTRAVVTALDTEPDLVKVKIYEIERWHFAQGGRLQYEPR